MLLINLSNDIDKYTRQTDKPLDAIISEPTGWF